MYLLFTAIKLITYLIIEKNKELSNQIINKFTILLYVR